MASRKNIHTEDKRGRKKSVKIFISHSHLDASFATLICNFLKTSELVEEEIRCTSVARQGLKLGQDVEETIKKEIEKSRIVIGFLTKASLKSSNVLFELGAAWGLRKILIPIRGPRVSVLDLPEWLQKGHQMEWTHRACWEQFEEILRDDLGKRIKNKKRFHEMIDKLVEWQPDNQQVGRSPLTSS